jgi:predicted enzyme related to lactoylglutathione lyase
MPTLPSGTELVRPFIPATDFERSKGFYEALGFERLVDGDVAIYRMGTSGFILQPVTEHARARNMMMQLMVDDLDAWWARIEALDLVARFGTTMMRAPAMQPWGLRVAFVTDPGGVLWHVAERRPGVVQD